MTNATDAKNGELLARALELSITDVVLTKLIKNADEEITTAALLGFFASNIAWTSALLASSGLSPLSWIHYSKHKKDMTSEAYTGADFAMVLRLSKSSWRAAIFQAKRSEGKNLSFKHLHISPAREDLPPEPQIMRLRDHSLSILTQKPLPDGKAEWSTEDLSFAHYLIYHDDDAYLSPLSDHAEEIKKIALTNIQIKQEGKGKLNLDEFRALWGKHPGKKVLHPNINQTRRFSDLLRLGVTESPGDPAPGWIQLNGSAEASAFINQTCLLMDVFEGSHLEEPKPTVANCNDLGAMRRERLKVSALVQKPVPKESATKEQVPKKSATRNKRI